MNRRSRRRRGSWLFCVIAVMAVVTSLVALMARDAIMARREVKLRLQLHQTDRLLDAGILRAAKQLKQNSNYDGEVWTPDVQFSDRETESVVRISVNEARVTVVARIGAGPHSTALSHEFELESTDET